MRRLTRKAWFGPKKHFGWGLTIYAWQGWVVTLVAALVAASMLVLQPTIAGIVAAGVVLVIYIIVALLTGDSPGGPRRPA
jgi:hypothetical protein